MDTGNSKKQNKLKERIKKACSCYMVLEEIKYKMTSEKTFDLFVFGKKRAFDIPIKMKSKLDRETFSNLFLDVIQEITNKPLYSLILHDGGRKHSLLVSKKPFPKSKRYSDKIFGRIFGFPECCIKKYCEENDKKKGQSVVSAERYIKQCEELKISKDPFDINRGFKAAYCSKFGFVPCHPRCKNALKVVEEYKKINREMK